MRTPLRPRLMVLFGGTGDLARRKLLPGLFHLSQAGLLPECRILNTSLDPLDDAGFRAHARSAIDEFERAGFPEAVWDSAAGARMSGSPTRTSTGVRRTRGSATSVTAAIGSSLIRFGKNHGAADAEQYVGREPEGANLEEQGFGWKHTFGSSNAGDTITSGLEGAWTTDPTKWENNFFENPFGHEWELTKSPGRAQQWRPMTRAADNTVPDAHDPSTRHHPVMLTTDLALRFDPIYEPISQRFHANPDLFADAFARAWFKLTHRDMGPVSGPRSPKNG